MICPYCRTENAPGATRCAHCTSWMTEPPAAREWTRAREGAWLGGVALGLARRFSLPPAAVRIAFVVAALVGGWGVVVYLALWIIMPREPIALPAGSMERSEAEARSSG